MFKTNVFLCTQVLARKLIVVYLDCRIIRGIPSHLLCSPGGEESSEVSSDSSGNNPQPPPLEHLEQLPPMENNAR